MPDLPALLPEVWLHWDPKTVAERGPNALLRFRMDFLLLLPAGARIVVEVDGKYHYADQSFELEAVALAIQGKQVWHDSSSQLPPPIEL